MNINKLFILQRALDKHILEEQGLKSEHLILKKKTALRTELGELMNEIPEYFKFWSAKKKNDLGKALVEYVDGLHFVLSIGLEIDCDIEEVSKQLSKVKFRKIHPLLLLEELHSFIGHASSPDYFTGFILNYLELGLALGFSLGDIEQAYYSKNMINHTRQDTGY